MRRMTRTRARGQVFIEFCLLMPALVMIFLVIVDLGWMIFNQSVGLNASRHGARVASIGRSGIDVEAAVRNAAYGLPVTDVRVTVLDGQGQDLGRPDDRTTGNFVRVDTTVGFVPLGFLFDLLPDSLPRALRSHSTYMIN